MDWTGRGSNPGQGRYFAQDIHSFIHSGHFYSAPSSLQLLRGAPDYSTDTVSEFHAKVHMQLQVTTEIVGVQQISQPVISAVPPRQLAYDEHTHCILSAGAFSMPKA